MLLPIFRSVTPSHRILFTFLPRYCQSSSQAYLYKKVLQIRGPAYLSRYSDWLRDGRSGGRIPGGESFRTCTDRPGAHPASCKLGTGYFPVVKSGRAVTLTPSPPSSSVVKKVYSYTSTPPMGRTACIEIQCLNTGAIYLYLLTNLLHGAESFLRS